MMRDRVPYQERVRSQTLKWAMGHPYHNKIDNECCPDFSCCVPALFEQDQAKRWQHYHNKYQWEIGRAHV